MSTLRVHTRAVVRARKQSSFFWQHIEDFGIPWQRDHSVAHKHPSVVDRVEQLMKRYDVVSVRFCDVG